MDKEYETQNLDEASFLLYHRFKILRKKKEGKKTTIFFEDSKKLQQKLVDFMNGDSVEPNKFLRAYRSIRDFALKPSDKYNWQKRIGR